MMIEGRRLLVDVLFLIASVVSSACQHIILFIINDKQHFNSCSVLHYSNTYLVYMYVMI